MKFFIILLLLHFIAIPSIAHSFALDGDIDLNKASTQVLTGIDGGGLVSEDLAKSIETYREIHGSFKSADDLLRVPGMTTIIFTIINPVKVDEKIISRSSKRSVPTK